LLKQNGYSEPQWEARKNMESAVGIIFMRGDDLWIDSTPVSAAADYGDLKTHEKGHPDYWEQLQECRSVPQDEEYDETPRGRATFDARKNIYYLFLDRCISDRPEMIARVFQVLRLPPSPATEILADSHYICPGCRPKTACEDDEEW
jgi:hypothetical protein